MPAQLPNLFYGRGKQILTSTTHLGILKSYFVFYFPTDPAPQSVYFSTINPFNHSLIHISTAFGYFFELLLFRFFKVFFSLAHTVS